MNYYKILGVDENSTLTEIKQAYDNQVKTFKDEIKDEKRLEKFLELFKEAYESLNKDEKILNRHIKTFDEEVNDLFNKNKIKEKSREVLQNKDIINFEDKTLENNYDCTILMSREEIMRESLIENNKPKKDRIIFKSREDFEEFKDFFDNEEEERVEKKIRKKKSINKDIRKSNNSIKKVKEQDNKEKLELKKYYNKVRSNIPSLLLVVVPIIVVLSTLIFLFKIII